MSDLWNRKNYLMDIPFLIASNIYEYDIQKANINVLYSLGLISKEYYDKLYNMNRMDRQVEIGYLLKYTEGLSDKLSDGIALYRKKLFESNGLDNNDILSIKNDAIFVINKILKTTEFDTVCFVLKNSYSSYMKLDVKGDTSNGKLEVYFKSDQVNGTVVLDIKGISDDKLELHHGYMASIIAEVIYNIEVGNIGNAITYIREMYNSYIGRKLPLGYYRNFNASSDYTVIVGDSQYSMNSVSVNMLSALNISYNLNLLRELYKNLTDIYFQTVR